MKSKIYFLAFFLFVFMACKKEDELTKQDSTKQELTYIYFKDNLKSDMTYNSIVAKFGEPSKDIGSGIHIYVYQLSDTTQIWIGYADKIYYARHMDKEQKLIKDII
jgi:hypothetical protein